MSQAQLNLPPTHDERRISQEGLQKLIKGIEAVKYPENLPQIVVMETSEPIKIPFRVLEMLKEILKNFRDGNAVSIVPVGTAFTTQMAAEFLNCSRPHITKLIDQGKLKATLVGRHRRIQVLDLMEFKKKMIKERKAALSELMKNSEELGMYETDQ